MSAEAFAKTRSGLLAALKTAAPPTAGRAWRVELPLATTTNAIQALRSSSASPRLAWYDRESDCFSLGFGAADSFAGPSSELPAIVDALRSRLTSDQRYYGGVAFPRPANMPGGDEWASFGPLRFVLPLLEFRQDPAGLRCAVNLWGPDAAAFADCRAHAEALLADLHWLPEAQPTQLPPLAELRELPGHDAWLATVEQALAQLAVSDLRKIVLARQTIVRFAQPLDPWQVLLRLGATAPSCYRFYFEFTPGEAFIGCSPETLFVRRGRDLRSEALAGTRARGRDEAEDAALEAELLASAKERREHSYVLDSIQEVLAPSCGSGPEVHPVTVLKLPRVQHLKQEISATLSDADDAAILRALHPTPAVGGVPTELAVTRIAELEAFDRGWYAGALGWLGEDAATFGVGIRSALVSGDTLRAYAGAGIVEASVPEAEWAETANKLASFLNLVMQDAEEA